MAVNLLEMLSSQLGSTQYSQIGNLLGTNESTVKSAMGAALPSILGSVINNGSTPSGAAGLMNMLKKGNFDGSMLNNLGGLFGGGNATDSLMNSGSSILTSLMGNKLGGVTDMIASLTGMNKSKSTSLLSMAAPLVLSMLGRYVKNKALDASGLSSFLGTQKKHVASALPAGMGSLLGFSTPDVVRDARTTTTNTVNTGRAAVAETANTGGSILNKILPIALIALLGLGVWWFMRDTDAGQRLGQATENAADNIAAGADNLADKTGELASDAANKIERGADAAVDAAGNALDATTRAAREALNDVKFAANSVGAKFNEFIIAGAEGNRAFRFNNLNFAVGKADISGAYDEVDNLASVLKAYPNIHIQISGHTDNTGNAATNKSLSQARAESVKNRLVAQGVDASRISTVGYGSEKPVASNDTEEGRAENRRIEIRITKK